MVDLQEFAKNYYNALKDILSALPESATLPSFLRETSFVIACVDRTGKVALEITSHKNVREFILENKVHKPKSSNYPAVLSIKWSSALENFLFSQDDKSKSVTVTIKVMYTVLSGLAFSNREYCDKYWKDAKFARHTGGSIPFMVTPNGSMLGIDLLWGAERDGNNEQRLFEFIKLYGKGVMLPKNIQEVRDEAYRDLCIVLADQRPDLNPHWSFTDFLAHLGGAIDTNVLLLGSYRSEEILSEFEELKSALEVIGYRAFLLKDAPDLPRQSTLEKLEAAIMCSCFVIVIDKELSGHNQELEHLLQNPRRPVIVLRKDDAPTSYFGEDRLRTNEFFKVVVLDAVSSYKLLPHIKWAKDLNSKMIENLNKINSWRS